MTQPPRDSTGRSLAELAALLGKGKAPPVHLWHPDHCGDSFMRIARDGTWFHEGSPIGRIELVKLFASILRREADGSHVLVTPHEKLSITIDDPALADAESSTLEDSVYPKTGDPGIDSLHYALVLDWEPSTRTLAGETSLTFRAAADDREFQLDLAPSLNVESVEVDGEQVSFAHNGKDLVITSAVREDERYQAHISYSGTPEPVSAPRL